MTMGSEPTPITSICMENVVGVVRTAENVPERAAAQYDEILKRLDWRL